MPSSLFSSPASLAAVYEGDYDPGKCKTPTHFSASQLKTHALCKRKWWFEKVLGLRSPGSTATEVGTRVHRALEHHLNGTYSLHTTPWEDPKARKEHSAHVADSMIRRIAASGLRYLPDPPLDPDCIGIEIDIGGILQMHGLRCAGFIDLLDVTVPERPVVLDHKTAKSDRWIKNPRTLHVDIQMRLYALAAAAICLAKGDEFFPHEGVLVVHVVYFTGAPGTATRTEALLTPVDLANAYDDIEARVGALVETAKAQHPRDVPPTPSACSAFGGCPHLARCRALKSNHRSNP